MGSVETTVHLVCLRMMPTAGKGERKMIARRLVREGQPEPFSPLFIGKRLYHGTIAVYPLTPEQFCGVAFFQARRNKGSVTQRIRLLGGQEK